MKRDPSPVPFSRVSDTNEIERIRVVYADRERRLPADRYSFKWPHVVFAHQQRSRALLQLLVDESVFPLAGKTILDVGCGEGQQLLELVSWGADRGDLTGIDLLDARVMRAKTRLGDRSVEGSSAPDLRVGDASLLPWPDGSFDIVHQNTVFTSILDSAMRHAIAREIVRVLKPGGLFVWYDFAFNNPRNPDVRGIGAAEIGSLLPGCEVRLRRITLAPPIARRLVPLSWVGSLMLEKLVVFNTHYLGMIRKR